jgi:alanine racemase
MHIAHRLTCSREALRANWSWLETKAGVACGAAVKADGYGLGANAVVQVLADAGCRDFFVSTWWEAERLRGVPEAASVSVLHGLGPDDVPTALESNARPVLNSALQVQRWKDLGLNRRCDVMVDTGMNRLGLRPEEAGVLEGLEIDTLHSHLACADEEHLLNSVQLRRFREIAAAVPARRYSLANSAGICLGRDYSFDLVRPGLALYGGIPRVEARDHIQSVAKLEAQVVQRRKVLAGETCGYGATFRAERDTQVAILNIGYADGYRRSFSACGEAMADGRELPVLGRVSMDLIAVCCDSALDLTEGDWVQIDFDLERSAAITGKTQYELLTGLGQRFERIWN